MPPVAGTCKATIVAHENNNGILVSRSCKYNTTYVKLDRGRQHKIVQDTSTTDVILLLETRRTRAETSGIDSTRMNKGGLSAWPG